jgi:hypothetical protein
MVYTGPNFGTHLISGRRRPFGPCAGPCCFNEVVRWVAALPFLTNSTSKNLILFSTIFARLGSFWWGGRGHEQLTVFNLMPTQVSLLMTVSHLIHKISDFVRNLRKTDVPLHVGLLRLSSVHHLLEETVFVLSEVQFSPYCLY